MNDFDSQIYGQFDQKQAPKNFKEVSNMRAQRKSYGSIKLNGNLSNKPLRNMPISNSYNVLSQPPQVEQLRNKYNVRLESNNSVHRTDVSNGTNNDAKLRLKVKKLPPIQLNRASSNAPTLAQNQMSNFARKN